VPTSTSANRSYLSSLFPPFHGMSCAPSLGLTHDHNMSSVWSANSQIWLCSLCCVSLQGPSSWTL